MYNKGLLYLLSVALYLIGVQQGSTLALVLPLRENGVAFRRPSLPTVRHHRFPAVVEIVLPSLTLFVRYGGVRQKQSVVFAGRVTPRGLDRIRLPLFVCLFVLCVFFLRFVMRAVFGIKYLVRFIMPM